MSSHLDYKPRILIAEGPWGIEEGLPRDLYGGLGTAFGTVQSYDKVYHKCNWKTNWFLKTYYLSDWNIKQEAPSCPHCSESVPNMIQTLWTLKNLDKIQGDATYGAKTWPSSFYVGSGGFYLHGTNPTNVRPGQVIRVDYSKTTVKLRGEI